MATPLEDKLAVAREAQVSLWRNRRRRAFWMVVFWTTLAIVGSAVLSAVGVTMEPLGVLAVIVSLATVSLVAEAVFVWRGANIDAYVEVDRTAPVARRLRRV